MSCQMVARVSSALELTEFHSLSPPCDHSAETPGPLMPQPGALLAGNSIQEGLSTGSCRASALIPCMFSVSYQRHSEDDSATRECGSKEDAEMRRRGDAGKKDAERLGEEL